MQIVTDNISLQELKRFADERYADVVKAVVDIEKEIMAVGGELHADEERLLLDEDSEQQNLWGINIHLNEPRDKWIEFDSIINLKPKQNNRSRNVEEASLRSKIIQIVNSLIQ